MAHEVDGRLYTHASTAVTSMRGESGVDCSDSKMRMSWRYERGRGIAKGKRAACFLGDERRTWRWNSRVPGRRESPDKMASRKLIDICPMLNYSRGYLSILTTSRNNRKF